MVAPPEVPRNAGRKAKGRAKCDGIDRKERGQEHYKVRDTPKDTPARSGLDMNVWTAAERVMVELLKERVKRR
jgi:hypothetical protein